MANEFITNALRVVSASFISILCWREENRLVLKYCCKEPEGLIYGHCKAAEGKKSKLARSMPYSKQEVNNPIR